MIVGKRKVSSRKRKKVEYRRTEGDPRNTQASFRLQDFKMWKFSMFLKCFKLHVLFLLASSPSVNSKEILIPRQCAVCLDKDCANGVRKIYPPDSNKVVWVKANSPTGIQNCAMENLKPDAPCKMANGSLVQLADGTLRFEGINPLDKRRIFHSQGFPCADLINSKPSPGMCAVCLDKDCAIGVSEIYPAGGDTAIWPKANSPTGIQNCSMENLKADAPCKMANGSLVQLADETLRFEGINPPDKRRIFHSQSFPCADLNLPPSSTPSPVTKAPKIPVADNKGCIGIGIGILIISIGIGIGSIGIGICIGIGIGFLIWKKNIIFRCKSCGQGQDKDYRHGNNKVPPHDAEDCDENTMWKQPLKGEVPNENVNRVHREDGSVGPEGYLDDSPV